MRLFQIDAFAGAVFKGNPAGVVPLESWPDDEVLRKIAMENNLSETAFFCEVGVEGGADYKLRWFSPVAEIDLCGHATVATAHALWTELGFDNDVIKFTTRSGEVGVFKKDEGLYELDFPKYGRGPVDQIGAMADALGVAPDEVFDANGFLVGVFDNKRQIHEMKPDLTKVAAFEQEVVAVTAPGAGHDYVCRLFAPKHNIAEDPATGSLQCALAPYWAEKLGKTTLAAHQVSEREGEFVCEVDSDRVRISGKAVTFMKGEIVASLA